MTVIYVFIVIFYEEMYSTANYTVILLLVLHQIEMGCVYRRSGGTCCLHIHEPDDGHSKCPRNVRKSSPAPCCAKMRGDGNKHVSLALYSYTVIILSGNQRLPFPVLSFIILTWPTRPAAHRCGEVTTGSEKRELSDKIRTLFMCSPVYFRNSVGQATSDCSDFRGISWKNVNVLERHMHGKCDVTNPSVL